MRNLLRTLIILPVLSVGLFAQCGVERWPVKTGTDADVALVNLGSTTSTTIANLVTLTAPSSLPQNNRVQPTETTVFVINATATLYKLESDSDYHVVISDGSGNTMIVEIPSPSCVGTGSPFTAGIGNARSEFNARFTPTTSFQTANIPVQVKGVGFFDFLHGQTGVAPNGIELHPVLDIIFNPSSNPDFSITAPATLTVNQGASGNTTVSTAVSGGFNSAIALTASGQPSGVTTGFNPSTIAAPGSGSSTMTVNAATSTTPGTYTLTATGTGGGKTHGTNISLTVPTSGGGTTTDIISDGGFEGATVSGNSAPGWTATTSISGHNIILKNGAFPHAGTNLATLGGTNNEADTLTQTVSIASGATAASLTFWTNIVTQETSSSVFDTLKVEIHNSSGTLLATPLTLSNTNSTSSNNTNGTYFQPAAIDLTAYAGQTIQILFRAACDFTLPTTFRIDDVSLRVTTPGSGGGDTTPPTTSITAPANGATVSGTTAVTATASDNVGVVKMELYIDGALTTSNTNAASLSFSWNTTTVANGSHTLVSKAYDAAANVGTSATITVTVSNATAQQLIGNPGFENGSGNPSPWTATAGVVSNSTSEPPHAGTWDAWMDGYGTTHTDTISQTVTIPSTITTATLTFWLHIDTAETSTTTAFDTLKVQIQNTSGTVLSTLATYSNLNKNTGYSQKTFDLTSFKGQTIKLVLIGAEDSTLQTSFVVDDFALNVQ